MSIPLGDLVSHSLNTGGPHVVRKRALSKNSGPNPVTFYGFGEGLPGPLKVWPLEV